MLNIESSRHAGVPNERLFISIAAKAESHRSTTRSKDRRWTIKGIRPAWRSRTERAEAASVHIRQVNLNITAKQGFLSEVEKLKNKTLTVVGITATSPDSSRDPRTPPQAFVAPRQSPLVPIPSSRPLVSRSRDFLQIPHKTRDYDASQSNAKSGGFPTDKHRDPTDPTIPDQWK